MQNEKYLLANWTRSKEVFENKFLQEKKGNNNKQ